MNGVYYASRDDSLYATTDERLYVLSRDVGYWSSRIITTAVGLGLGGDVLSGVYASGDSVYVSSLDYPPPRQCPARCPCSAQPQPSASPAGCGGGCGRQGSRPLAAGSGSSGSRRIASARRRASSSSG